MNVDIIALGESAKDYESNGSPTIGVNDIHSRFKTDYVLCVDPQTNFDDKRLTTLWQTRCKGFYSHLDEWNFLPNFNKIELDFTGSINLNGKLPISIVSPYVAVGLAYQMFKPETITLYGVDLINHPKLKGRLHRIQNDFRELFLALMEKNCQLKLAKPYGALVSVLPS